MKTIYQELVRKYGFSPSQKKILEIVQGSLVLEIGASSGYMTKMLSENGNVVDVVEVDSVAAKKAFLHANEVFIGSIENEDVQKKLTKKYDFIVCADVLEHLINPDIVLKDLKNILNISGKLLISIPNIACWNMRLDLLRGKFDYQESGLLDKTHLRFYTYHSFLQLLKKNGYKIEKVYPTETKIPLEYSLLKIPVLGKIFVTFLKFLLLKYFPNLIIVHYVIQAKV